MENLGIIRGLNWKQPFGTLMLPPFNKIETRTWDTPFRGWVLMISSQKGYEKAFVEEIAGPQQYQRIANAFMGINKSTHIFPYGHAFAIGYLDDCRPMKKSDESQAFVEYHPWLFAHVYKDVQAIEPFEIKGAQRWKKLDQEATWERIVLK